MNILGIDFGTEHVGLALGDTETGLTEPMKVDLKPSQIEEIKRIYESNSIEKVILGISEGELAKLTKKFADKLAQVGIKVEFYDETLSTQDALSDLEHLSPRKRKMIEHSVAAAEILRNWLEDNV